jgi:hypothetical protein
MIVQVAKKLVSVISQSKIIILTKLKVPFWIIFNSLHSSRFNNVQIISGSKVSFFPIICPKIIVVVCIQYILSQNYCPGMYWIHTRFRLFFFCRANSIFSLCIDNTVGMYWIHTRFRLFFFCRANSIFSLCIDNTVGMYWIHTRFRLFFCPKIIVVVCIQYILSQNYCPGMYW